MSDIAGGGVGDGGVDSGGSGDVIVVVVAVGDEVGSVGVGVVIDGGNVVVADVCYRNDVGCVVVCGIGIGV